MDIRHTEATKRLQLLRMFPCVRDDFKNGKINYSYDGIVYYLTENEESRLHQLEEKYHFLTYHLIQDKDRNFYILFVSDSADWKEERQSLQEGKAAALKVNRRFEDPVFCNISLKADIRNGLFLVG